MRTQLHGSGSAGLGWGGVGERRRRSPGERRTRDLATSANECLEVRCCEAKARAEICTARHEHVFIGDERGKLSNHNLNARG